MSNYTIDFKRSVYYICDHGLQPEGLGAIFNGEHKTLVTDRDCGPQSLEQAQQSFKNPPNNLVNLTGSIGEDFEDVQRQLNKVLVENKVVYVIDYDSAWDFHDPTDVNFGIFTLEDWRAIMNDLAYTI